MNRKKFMTQIAFISISNAKNKNALQKNEMKKIKSNLHKFMP